MRKPVFACMSVLMALPLVVSGCGTTSASGKGSDSGKITLTIEFQRLSTDDQWANWMQDNIKLFEQAHPNVTFNVTDNASSNTYLTKVTSQMAAGTTADIFEGWTSNRMQEFVNSGRVLDITSYLKSNATLNSEVMKTVLPATTFNGKVYGLPTTLDSEVVFYNKDIFQKYGLQVPKTYNDLLNIIKTLKTHNITPISMSNQESFNGAIPLQMIEERIGGLDSYQGLVDGSIPWTSQPVLQASSQIQQLIHMGAFNANPNSTSSDQSIAALQAGQAAMYINGTWDIQQLTGKNMNFGAFNFPSISGGKGSANDLIELPNDALYISSHAKNQSTAEEFLAFCLSKPRQLAEAKANQLIATNTTLPSGTMSPLAVEVHQLQSAATGSMFPFDLPLGTNMGEQFDNATQLLYTGQSPNTVFENFENLVKSSAN
ncbi:ABC transporter substrate-binding protein [Alicyclobacillus fastidiosus]|uniref:Extracellular solute-binding protein n=1 Tax=Alicyclobacillus fastidiosus TaxID=392011 RepID=A0ABV5AL88_9BACL|nr:extracellular solute-binding protein [Alicyclobacillus fastidiosus]WEH08272.1 extracellular solute-binding protein [Alicyclobacillus fastidiosus]